MKFTGLIACLVVIRIALFAYFIVSGGNFMTFDAPHYIQLAANINANQVFSLSSQEPFAVHVWRTPGYPLFLALISALGMKSLYWVCFWQELVYGVFGFIFYRYSKPLLGEKISKIALVFLLLEPGGLAFPKMIMSETLFMPFLMGGMLATGYYLKGLNPRYLLMAGGILGIGVLIRPVVLYLPLVIAIVLIIFDFRNGQRWLHTSGFLLAFVMALSPWLARNYYHYGQVYLTGQSSYGPAYFFVPIVKGYATGTSFEEGWSYVEKRIGEESSAQAEILGRSLRPLEIHNVERKIAIEELLEYPMEFMNRWGVGVLKCMFSPLIIELYEVYKIPPEDRLQLLQVLDNSDSVFSGALFYLKNQDKLYLLDLIFSVLLGLFALLGALRIVTMKNCFLWLIMLCNFYFITIPGPMSHGRFRIPVEVFWFIQAYYGLTWCVTLFSQGLRKNSATN